MKLMQLLHLVGLQGCYYVRIDSIRFSVFQTCESSCEFIRLYPQRKGQIGTSKWTHLHLSLINMKWETVSVVVILLEVVALWAQVTALRTCHFDVKYQIMPLCLCDCTLMSCINATVLLLFASVLMILVRVCVVYELLCYCSVTRLYRWQKVI